MTASVVLEARGLTKRFGQVVALDGTDFEVRAGEIMAIIGDNGAGKSSLIKVLSGAMIPDSGEIQLDGAIVRLRDPLHARRLGIETVYQDLAVAPAMTIAENVYLGREVRRAGVAGRWLRLLDHSRMQREAIEHLQALDIRVQSITQPLETLSGGQRQGVAVARSAAFARHVVVLDEPTAALGVREGRTVLDLIRRIRDRGQSVVLISHNMPNVFAVADRIHVQRLGRRVAILDPRLTSMSDAVAVMTGAADLAIVDR
ncbi:MAG: ATP-binding cassette domain-containing protein [Gemmatimonas sp.]